MATVVRLTGDYKKAKVKLVGLKKEVNLETDRRIFDMVRTGATATRRYINSRTHGEGKLAQSIKWKKGKSAQSTSWMLYQDPSMTMWKGKNYALHVDKGFIPHIVSLNYNTNLQRWVQRNLGSDALDKIRKTGNKMKVGYKTGWQPEGLQFGQYAFNHINNHVKTIDRGVINAIKK